MQGKTKRIISTTLFLLGVLLAMALAGLTAWAAFEGLSYFSTGAGYDPYGGMHCPILISRTETGFVRADFSNPTDQAEQPYYEVEISGVVASRQLENQITVLPHTTQQVSWPVTASDVDVPPFVFVKMDVLPIGDFATREATCGILVAGLPGIRGATAMSIAVALALLFILIGLILPAWGLSAREASQFDREANSNSRRAAQVLGVLAAAALLAGLMGWWLATIVLLAMGLLLLPLVVPAMIMRR